MAKTALRFSENGRKCKIWLLAFSDIFAKVFSCQLEEGLGPSPILTEVSKHMYNNSFCHRVLLSFLPDPPPSPSRELSTTTMIYTMIYYDTIDFSFMLTSSLGVQKLVLNCIFSCHGRIARDLG